MNIFRRYFGPSPAFTDVLFWSLDLETGGLVPQHDPILSVGMVPIREGTIRLAESFSSFVRPSTAHVSDSRSLQTHNLIPADLRAAPSLHDVLGEVDVRLREGVLLVHFAAVDVAFLKAAYKLAGRTWPSPAIVDTARLLERLADVERMASRVREPSFNLGAARRDLGLPEYPSHDALTDAVATAELFLLLVAQLGARTLRRLL